MPRGCRFPGRLKLRQYEVMLTQLSCLTATPIKNEGDRAQLQQCIIFFRDAEFSAAEQQHIATHLRELISSRDHAQSLLAPLLVLFPDISAT